MTSLSPQQYILLGYPWILSSSTAVLGYSIRDKSLAIRFLTGFALIKSALFIQNKGNAQWKKILPAICSDNFKTNYWMYINGIFTFCVANSMCGIFGGNDYYKKHGIDSYKKVLISSLSNGQVYFKKNKNAKYKALKNLFKVFSVFSIGYIISKCLKSNPLICEKIKRNEILHMNLLGFLISIEVFFQCIPSNIHYLIFSYSLNDDIEVIPPFDFAFFSSSIRSFWKNWSRPVGELLRYMVYKPLGGRKRFWLSVPALFATNCILHYDFSLNTYGYRAINEWNKGFAIMGISISIHMLMENIFLKYNDNDKHDINEKEVDDNHDIENSLYWRIWCFGLFNISMASTLYVTRKKAMVRNIENVTTTLCPF